METQNLAKWISELQAQIDQVKRIAIAAGSSGGDSVTITPTVESGNKIADFTIGEDTSGSLYSPNVFGVCDYDNLIVPTTALSEQVNYTATEDCFFWLSLKNAQNTDANIAINSKNAYGIYGPAMTQYKSFPLMKGDTITSSGLQFDQYTTYRVYKVKYSNLSVSNSAKRRKNK